MAPFDPVSALIGGALIGLAAVLLMLLNGRVAGVSGILGEALTGEDRGWRVGALEGGHLRCVRVVLNHLQFLLMVRGTADGRVCASKGEQQRPQFAFPSARCLPLKTRHHPKL